jgi:hypothetical protein
MLARKLKFYPLSLRKAMAPTQPLAFAAPTFTAKVYETNVETYTLQLTEKLFSQCSTWQLLNFTMAQVLDLPGRLSKELGISAAYVEKVMKKYIIQTVGKDTLENEFGIRPAKYLISAAYHYSWPKPHRRSVSK